MYFFQLLQQENQVKKKNKKPTQPQCCFEHGAEGVGAHQRTDPPGWAVAQQAVGHQMPQAATLALVFK